MNRQEPGQLYTLNLKPRSGSSEARKPAELIQVTGHEALTLNARRAITVLWHNAHMQGVEEGRDYTIEIDELKADSHKGYERIEEAITALMRTLLTVKLPDGKTRRVAFLGGNDCDDPDRPAGVLTYSFDRRLVEILRNSKIWGKITLPVLMAFSSKYAVSLYENMSQMTGLDIKQSHTFSLAEFRNMLGVQAGKYKSFGEFNKHVLKPAVDEVNALASFRLSVAPVKQAKRVVSVLVMWMPKDLQQLQEADRERDRPRVGRRARITGTVDAISVLPALPSASRQIRAARKGFRPKTS